LWEFLSLLAIMQQCKHIALFSVTSAQNDFLTNLNFTFVNEKHLIARVAFSMDEGIFDE